MKTQLTEKEAWLKIAEWFTDQERKELNSNCIVTPEGYHITGMCLAINTLYSKELIDRATLYLMEDKIAARNPNGGYMFPETPEGDKQRVKFCQERATEL